MRIIERAVLTRALLGSAVVLFSASIICGNLPGQAMTTFGQSKKVKPFFGDEYNPENTIMTAISCDEKYEGVPQPLKKKDPLHYVQPWNGYCPPSNLKDEKLAKCLPCQTYNIKTSGIYRGIEVQGNKWMLMSCEEAKRGAETSGCPFGAVIVQIDDETGNVIRYWKNHNHVTEWIDPTAHAEVTAIRAVCKELGVFNLGKIEKDDPSLKLPQTGKTSHCEIYSSAEPCPMCYAAIRWARINTLVFAATRMDSAAQGVNFSDDNIYTELATPMYLRKELGMNVYQSTVPNSLDAFNTYKRTELVRY